MNTSATIIADFPAWTIFAAQGVPTLEHGDEIAVRINGQYRPCSVGTVSGVAAEYRKDAAANVAHAKGWGHNLFWIHPQASVLSADPQEKRAFIGLTFGDVVNIRCSVDGTRSFYLRRAPNGNIRLEPVTRTSGGRTNTWTPNGASGVSVNPALARYAAAARKADARRAADVPEEEEQEYSITVATEYVVRVPAGTTLAAATNALIDELNQYEGEELELGDSFLEYGEPIRVERCATWTHQD